MEKKELTKNAKLFLRAISQGTEIPVTDSNKGDLILLKEEGLISFEISMNGYQYPVLTQKGIAYVHVNPELKNPSIWDDRKFWISTGISIVALIISIIAISK